MSRVFIGLCLVFYVVTFSSASDVYLGIQAKGKKIDLGLAEFLPTNDLIKEKVMASKLRQVVLDDLVFCLYFNVHESGRPVMAGPKIDFEPWKENQTDVLVTVWVSLKNNFIDLTVKAFDVESSQTIWTKRFYASEREFRNVAHMISDEVVMRFTGEKGIFTSRITFINDSTGKKEVYTADYDGHNIKRITYNKSIALFPRWSPDGKEISFTSYHHGNPDLFVISSDGIVVKSVSVRQGLNTSARWAPDGESLVLTLSRGKSPDIFQISTTGRVIKRLTSGWGAEVAPCFSPNGKKIVYTSDKPGYPQLYVLQLKNLREKRLFSGNYADSPVWSPKGSRIAFSMISEEHRFDIFSADINGRNVVQLTMNEGTNENPSWSPDGRFIMFISTRAGKKELFVMAADGSMQKRVVDLKGNCFTPDWSH